MTKKSEIVSNLTELLQNTVMMTKYTRECQDGAVRALRHQGVSWSRIADILGWTERMTIITFATVDERDEWDAQRTSALKTASEEVRLIESWADPTAK